MAEKERGDLKEEIKGDRLLAEVKTKGYEYVQLRRVEYWKGRNSYVDLRTYHTDPGEEPEPRFPTRKGVHLKERLFLDLIGSAGFLPRQLLHSRLTRAYVKLQKADPADAVFEAFKRVEMHVREAAGFDADLVGTRLVRRAFDPNSGPLTDESTPLAERESIAHLFAGAIGSFKNPGSHRSIDVSYEDACRQLVLAALLLDIVDARVHQ